MDFKLLCLFIIAIQNCINGPALEQGYISSSGGQKRVSSNKIGDGKTTKWTRIRTVCNNCEETPDLATIPINVFDYFDPFCATDWRKYIHINEAYALPPESWKEFMADCLMLFTWLLNEYYDCILILGIAFFIKMIPERSYLNNWEDIKMMGLMICTFLFFDALFKAITPHIKVLMAFALEPYSATLACLLYASITGATIAFMFRMAVSSTNDKLRLTNVSGPNINRCSAAVAALCPDETNRQKPRRREIGVQRFPKPTPKRHSRPSPTVVAAKWNSPNPFGPSDGSASEDRGINIFTNNDCPNPGHLSRSFSADILGSRVRVKLRQENPLCCQNLRY
ncbi:uncharacterized protein LOC106178151 [Lingula anatina]|uniref:Uncharacterized protein LOC106178151 n=1 Tax=Lingula anatina TaxID=7574 RepID=A0A1S3K333_LINAN|nr:uncharacterized protein LOC106178151 [Lingula anatina]|eukprot:XP_013416671.1 uncharacterized protein LOC106178151 [Lingula anatina]